MYQQITQIADMIAALAGPTEALEKMVARHDRQIQDMLDPTPPPPPPPSITFDACFNAGSCGGSRPLGFHWHQNAPEVVASGVPQAREGAHMLECYLHRTESRPSYAHRTMGILCPDDDAEPDTRQSLMLPLRQEHWLAFSVFLPDDWVFDPLSTILWQAQAIPDAGETYRQPILHVIAKNHDWQVKVRWDPRKLSPASEGTTSWPGSKELYRRPLAPDLGKWTDWLFHVRWDWEENGFTRVWKNEELVADYHGPNCAWDERGPQIALGVYEFSWREQYWTKFDYVALWRRVWFDSVRIDRQRSDVTIPT